MQVSTENVSSLVDQIISGTSKKGKTIIRLEIEIQNEWIFDWKVVKRHVNINFHLNTVLLRMYVRES